MSSSRPEAEFYDVIFTVLICGSFMGIEFKEGLPKAIKKVMDKHNVR